jgi:uncharacterized protein (TIGR03083 family)
MVLASSASRATSVDTGELYELNRQRLVATIRAASGEELARSVPATPAWSIRDVLAHVVGISADLNALDFGTGDPEAWTAHQVESRREDSIEVIVDEWDREATKFEDGLRLLGYGIGSHYVADLHAHMQDVRMALGLDAARDPQTVLVALDFYLESLDETLRGTGSNAIELFVGEERHVVGVPPVVASVKGDPFELLRSLSGRRSLDQIRALDWDGDADSLAPQLSRYPLPEAPLLEL